MKKAITVLCLLALLTTSLAACGNKDGGDASSSAQSGTSASDSVSGSGESGTAGEPSGSGEASGSTSGAAQGDDTNANVTDDTTSHVTAAEQAPSVNLQAQDANLDVEAICVAADADYLYYIDRNDQHIYRVNHDGSDKKEIVTDECSWVGVNTDGNIEYCTNYDAEVGADSTYFTVDKNGENKVDNQEVVLDIFPIPDVVGKDGRTYYLLTTNDVMTAEKSLNPGIYAYTEGQDKINDGQLVLEGIVDSFCVIDDYVVASITTQDGSHLYRTNLDGSNTVKLMDDRAMYLSSSGERVYFVKSNDSKIYSLSIDEIKAAQ